MDPTQDDPDPLAVARRYGDAFNRGDEDALADCFAESGVILDGMAPHVWSGPDATRRWFRDAQAEADHLGIADFAMTLGEPLHNDVSGDAAYLVAPATLSFKVGGRQVNQTGATFTLAFRREAGRWRIAAWAWTKGAGGGTGDVAAAH